MTPEQAEQLIRQLVTRVDQARLRNDDKEIEILEAQIRDLKKITGPRHIQGIME